MKKTVAIILLMLMLAATLAPAQADEQLRINHGKDAENAMQLTDLYIGRLLQTPERIRSLKKVRCYKKDSVSFSVTSENNRRISKLEHRTRGKKKRLVNQEGITATILFILTTTAVKYACNRIAIKPTESARWNPWAVFISPFFSSIR